MSGQHCKPRAPRASRIGSRAVLGGAAMTAVFLGTGSGMAFAAEGDTAQQEAGQDAGQTLQAPQQDANQQVTNKQVTNKQVTSQKITSEKVTSEKVTSQQRTFQQTSRQQGARPPGGGLPNLIDVSTLPDALKTGLNAQQLGQLGKLGTGQLDQLKKLVAGGLDPAKALQQILHPILQPNHGNGWKPGPGHWEHGRWCPEGHWDQHGRWCPEGHWDKDGRWCPEGHWDQHGRWCPDGHWDKDGRWCPDDKNKDPKHDKDCSCDHKSDDDKSDNDTSDKDKSDESKPDTSSDKKSDDSSPDKVDAASTPDSSPKVEPISDVASTGSNNQVSAVPSGSADTGDGSSQPSLAAASSGLGGDIALGGGIAAAALLGAYGVQMNRRRSGAHRNR